jgi:hypothetical protein
MVLLPVVQELQDFLSELKVQCADGLIAARDDGTAWPSEKEMQTRPGRRSPTSLATSQTARATAIPHHVVSEVNLIRAFERIKGRQ